MLTFSLVRTGDWIAASTLPPWSQTKRSEVAPVAGAHGAANGSAAAALSLNETPGTPLSITCVSSGIVPKTGWYEARLPAHHANFNYFSQSNGRFVRKHEGERMLTLGVVPLADEALVVRTWMRE